MFYVPRSMCPICKHAVKEKERAGVRVFHSLAEVRESRLDFCVHCYNISAHMVQLALGMGLDKGQSGVKAEGSRNDLAMNHTSLVFIC